MANINGNEIYFGIIGTIGTGISVAEIISFQDGIEDSNTGTATNIPD